jgi:hypothetical protein
MSRQLSKPWFTGLNPELDDRTPIRLLAEGSETEAEAVLQAARLFLCSMPLGKASSKNKL